MTKMKSCMISFGPVESKSNGYFIRSYNIARSLAELNHDVLVMEFSEVESQSFMKSKERINFVHTRGNESCHNKILGMLKNVLTFDSFHAIKFQLYSFVELIRLRDYLKDCDFVFVEGALIPFGVIIPKIFGKKIILDTHCVNKLLALHFRKSKFWVYFARKILWDLLERFATTLSDRVIVVSEREKDFVQEEYKIPESKIFVVPNVIEIERRSYSKEELTNLRKRWGLENKIIVTFVGDLGSVQNKDAADYIINDLAPFLWAKRKNVVFLIIGKGNENFKYNLPNVVFTGFCKDIAPFLELSDVCIAPLRVGCGVKTKVLQYLAHGKPIVTTPIGIEGIEVEEPNGIIISDIVTFKKALVEGMQILGRLKKIAMFNKELVERQCSPRSFQMNFERCINHVTENI